MIFFVAGLAYGDEGKGTIVDYLTRIYGAKLVVRYNGGPQAGHRVVTANGQSHIFSQFGSGTLAGARTYLSEYMLIEPYALVNEADSLGCGLDRVCIHEAAVVITPYHWMANQIRELARDKDSKRHGSCGMGVGEARGDSLVAGSNTIFARDLLKSEVSVLKLRDLKAQKLEELKDLASVCMGTAVVYRQMEREDPNAVAAFYRKHAWNIVSGNYVRNCCRSKQTVIFEGAQGVLLDEILGASPFVTWTNTTYDNAQGILGTEIEPTRIGVIRTHMTRHGHGPFVTESTGVPASSDDHNTEGPWQGPVRRGWFDAVALRYSIKHAKPDLLAITHLDRAHEEFKYVNEYQRCGASVYTLDKFTPEYLSEITYQLLTASPVAAPERLIASLLEVRLMITSNGPRPQDKVQWKSVS